MPVQEKLSFSDLESLGSSPNNVKAYFRNKYGADPDGICVNSEGYYAAVAPTITDQYGLSCYKHIGPMTFEPETSAPPKSAVVGSNFAVNNSNSPAQVSLTVQGNWSDTSTWSWSITGGLKFSTKFGVKVGAGPVGGEAEVGAEISVSATGGQSGSVTTTKSTTANVTVTVPSRSKVKVSIVGMMRHTTMKFSAPVTIDGMFGANFPDRVQGHYFWFEDAGSILGGKTSTLNGEIKDTHIFDVQTEIGEISSL